MYGLISLLSCTRSHATTVFTHPASEASEEESSAGGASFGSWRGLDATGTATYGRHPSSTPAWVALRSDGRMPRGRKPHHLAHRLHATPASLPKKTYLVNIIDGSHCIEIPFDPSPFPPPHFGREFLSSTLRRPTHTTLRAAGPWRFTRFHESSASSARSASAQVPSPAADSALLLAAAFCRFFLFFAAFLLGSAFVVPASS